MSVSPLTVLGTMFVPGEASQLESDVRVETQKQGWTWSKITDSQYNLLFNSAMAVAVIGATILTAIALLTSPATLIVNVALYGVSAGVMPIVVGYLFGSALVDYYNAIRDGHALKGTFSPN